ncbi:unnamed protein product [Kluyveromyces dobzhanskii CBS 2104]|uniref:WGS project CCBQ000000000 data, contig 00107 n=1 Tax=Kluyveromyces dobzhanskii CBS 2104 TaxID=1427455 RepID=A0A0A8L0R0_9SACH|nr:unnamed protein product [Kluyveromyces dobzhanskii CBS 2104]
MESRFVSNLKKSPHGLLSKVLIVGILVNAWYFYYLTFNTSNPIRVNWGFGGSGKAPSLSELNASNFRDYVRPLEMGNSSAIFNTVNDALKQRNSDIHSVGVSFIPAVIPQGTLLYHAGVAEIPDGFEWVAFDYEFSLNFGTRGRSRGRNSVGRGRFPGPGGPGSGPGGKPGADSPDGDKKEPSSGEQKEQKQNFERRTSMLTFQATRDLNKVIYFDGGSAAKSSSGELDTQQLWSNVIGKQLGDNTNETDMHMPERLYASRICEWGKPLGLDGFIRVEMAFEMVICDFSNGLELVSNTTILSNDDFVGLPAPVSLTKENGWPIGDDGKLIEDQLTEEQKQILEKEDIYGSYLSELSAGSVYDHSKAAQFRDEGERRARLDFRYMVTGINRTWLHPDPNGRRLISDAVPETVHEELVADLKTVLSSDAGFDHQLSTDWQNVAREITAKFSPMLLSIYDTLRSNEGTAQERARKASLYYTNFVRRFQDTNQSFKKSKDFAVYQYATPMVPLRTDADFLIWSAFVNVVSEVIDTVFDVSETLNPLIKSQLDGVELSDSDNVISNVLISIENLMSTLKWVELNYRCAESCGYDGFCYTPSWGPSPFGWNNPDVQGSSTIGLKWKDDFNRYVIDENQQCVNLNTIINNKH